MHKLSSGDIRAEVLRLAKQRGADYKTNVVVTIGTEATQIDIAQMYEAPNYIDAILPELKTLMGTDNVTVDDGIHANGCSSCGYGSSYGFLLTFRPLDRATSQEQP